MLKVVLFLLAFFQLIPAVSAETVVIEHNRQTWAWNVASRLTHRGNNYKLCTYTNVKTGRVIPIGSINFHRILPGTIAMEVPESLISRETQKSTTSTQTVATPVKPDAQAFVKNLSIHILQPLPPNPSTFVHYALFDTPGVLTLVGLLCLFVGVAAWKFRHSFMPLAGSEILPERQRELENFSVCFEAAWERAFYGEKKLDVEKKIDRRAGRVIIPIFGRDANTFPNLREHAGSVAQALYDIESQPFAQKFERLDVEDVYSVFRQKRGVKFRYQMKVEEGK